ncbi:hypothetical protein Q8F55_001557 [Vanrija albida]|uniref:BZIP domain-containing protein n=1 Tax=Vanrija albida TaxID=181172 RepID=A0ABR3QGD6_9TREE
MRQAARELPPPGWGARGGYRDDYDGGRESPPNSNSGDAPPGTTTPPDDTTPVHSGASSPEVVLTPPDAPTGSLLAAAPSLSASASNPFLSGYAKANSGDPAYAAIADGSDLFGVKAAATTASTTAVGFASFITPAKFPPAPAPAPAQPSAPFWTGLGQAGTTITPPQQDGGAGWGAQGAQGAQQTPSAAPHGFFGFSAQRQDAGVAGDAGGTAAALGQSVPQGQAGAEGGQQVEGGAGTETAARLREKLMAQKAAREQHEQEQQQQLQYQQQQQQQQQLQEQQQQLEQQAQAQQAAAAAHSANEAQLQRAPEQAEAEAHSNAMDPIEDVEMADATPAKDDDEGSLFSDDEDKAERPRKRRSKGVKEAGEEVGADSAIDWALDRELAFVAASTEAAYKTAADDLLFAGQQLLLAMDTHRRSTRKVKRALRRVERARKAMAGHRGHVQDKEDMLEGRRARLKREVRATLRE